MHGTRCFLARWLELNPLHLSFFVIFTISVNRIMSKSYYYVFNCLAFIWIMHCTRWCLARWFELNPLHFLSSKVTNYYYFFFLIFVASEGLYYSLHIFMLYNDNQLHHLHTYIYISSLHLSLWTAAWVTFNEVVFNWSCFLLHILECFTRQWSFNPHPSNRFLFRSRLRS